MQLFMTMGAYQYRYEGEGKDTGQESRGEFPPEIQASVA
jgi:hypothetical protein